MNNIKSKYFTQKIKKEESLFQEKVRIIFKSTHHPTNKKPHEVGLDVVAFLPNPFNNQLYLNIFIYNMI